MFFKSKPTPSHDPSVEVRTVIAEAIPNADEETRAIVTAIVGLCGAVAYADRNFTEVEQRAVRDLLANIDGMDESGASEVVQALHRHIVSISTTESARHARTLMDLAARDLRLQILDLLLDVAAADDVLEQMEVVVLRQLAKAMGLEQADYNELQGRHRSLLAALK